MEIDNVSFHQEIRKWRPSQTESKQKERNNKDKRNQWDWKQKDNPEKNQWS